MSQNPYYSTPIEADTFLAELESAFPGVAMQVENVPWLAGTGQDVLCITWLNPINPLVGIGRFGANPKVYCICGFLRTMKENAPKNYVWGWNINKGDLDRLPPKE